MKNIGRILFVLGVLFWGTNASFGQCVEQLTLEPTDDAETKSYNPTTNFGSSNYFRAYRTSFLVPIFGGGWTTAHDTARSYIKFDISSLPSEAIITEAKLILSGNGGHSGGNDSYIQRVTSSWAENTVTWNTKPFVTTSNQVMLDASSSSDEDYEVDIMDFVVGWRENTFSNHGVSLRLQDEGTNNVSLSFHSKESTPGKEPKLVINYVIPDEVVLSPSGDALVRSDNPFTNYGSIQYFQSSRLYISGGRLPADYIERGFAKFNLNALPSNAIIVEAELRLYGSGNHNTDGGSNASYLRKVDGSWTENTITWANQPGNISTGQISLNQSTSSDQDYFVDVTDFVNEWFDSPSSNNGLVLMLQSESASALRRLSFYSKESSEPDKTELVIKYCIPDLNVQVSDLGNVSYSCESDSITQLNDGFIELDVNGDFPPYSYSWSPGGMTTKDIYDLEPGSYTVTVTDSLNNEVQLPIGVGYDVDWYFPVRTQVEDNGLTLRNIFSPSGWCSGATATNIRPEGSDGWVEYTITNTTDLWMVGLQNEDDINHCWGNLDHALMKHHQPNTELRRVHSGSQTTLSDYEIGDIIRLERVGNTIKYYRNGEDLGYSSTTNGDKPMLISTLLWTNNGTIKNMRTSFPPQVGYDFQNLNSSCNATDEGGVETSVCAHQDAYYDWGLEPEDTLSNLTNVQVGIYDLYAYKGDSVTFIRPFGIGHELLWENTVSSNVTGTGSIERVSGGGDWNAGANSANKLMNGEVGWIEFRVTYNDKKRAIGLAPEPDSLNQNISNLDYGLFFDDDGKVYRIIDGVIDNVLGAYEADDVFRIHREVIPSGDRVTWYQNGRRMINILSVNINDEYYIQASLYDNGSGFEDVRASFCRDYQEVFGEFTVGDSQSDFNTIADAINSLHAKEIVGDGVTFKIKPGVHEESLDMGASLDFISSDSAYIYFVPSDSGSVLVKPANGEFAFKAIDKNNVLFQSIDFTTRNVNNSIELDNSKNIFFFSSILLENGEGNTEIFVSNNSDLSIVSSTISGYGNGVNIQDSRHFVFFESQIQGSKLIRANNTNSVFVQGSNFFSTSGNDDIIFINGVTDTLNLSGNQVFGSGNSLVLKEIEVDAVISGNKIHADGGFNGISVDFSKELVILENTIISDQEGQSGISISNENYSNIDKNLMIAMNNLYNYNHGIKIMNFDSTNVLILNNQIDTTSVGIELQNTGNDFIIELAGNHIVSDSSSLKISNVDASVLVRANTLITNGSSMSSSVIIDNVDDIEFCSNNVINFTSDYAIEFSGVLPQAFDSRWNNWYSHSSSTISNDENLVLSDTTNTKLDPKGAFDDSGVYQLTYMSSLINKEIDCYDELIVFDMLNTLREEDDFDIGAVEAEKTLWDGLLIEPKLEDGLFFTPEGGGLYTDFEVEGLNNYSQFTFTITDRDSNVLFQSSSSGVWDGSLPGTSELVDEGLYLFSLSLDSEEANGVVYVKRN